MWPAEVKLRDLDDHASLADIAHVQYEGRLQKVVTAALAATSLPGVTAPPTQSMQNLNFTVPPMAVDKAMGQGSPSMIASISRPSVSLEEARQFNHEQGGIIQEVKNIKMADVVDDLPTRVRPNLDANALNEEFKDGMLLFRSFADSELLKDSLERMAKAAVLKKPLTHWMSMSWAKSNFYRPYHGDSYPFLITTRKAYASPMTGVGMQGRKDEWTSQPFVSASTAAPDQGGPFQADTHNYFFPVSLEPVPEESLGISHALLRERIVNSKRHVDIHEQQSFEDAAKRGTEAKNPEVQMQLQWEDVIGIGVVYHDKDERFTNSYSEGIDPSKLDEELLDVARHLGVPVYAFLDVDKNIENGQTIVQAYVPPTSKEVQQQETKMQKTKRRIDTVLEPMQEEIRRLEAQMRMYSAHKEDLERRARELEDRDAPNKDSVQKKMRLEFEALLKTRAEEFMDDTQKVLASQAKKKKEWWEKKDDFEDSEAGRMVIKYVDATGIVQKLMEEAKSFGFEMTESSNIESLDTFCDSLYDSDDPMYDEGTPFHELKMRVGDFKYDEKPVLEKLIIEKMISIANDLYDKQRTDLQGKKAEWQMKSNYKTIQDNKMKSELAQIRADTGKREVNNDDNNALMIP